MELELGKINISKVVFGDRTRVEKGILYVDKAELIKEVAVDKRLSSIEVELASPGEEVRIIPVKDVVEPRVKVEGAGGVFPGFLHEPETVGGGKTKALKGVAVVTCGRMVGFQEGVIDMSGPGAAYSPFSVLNNVVLVLEPQAGISRQEHEEALRMAGLRGAAYLGEAAREVEVDETVFYAAASMQTAAKKAGGKSLPKVVYVKMLLSEGLLHDTYLYGVDVKKILPTFLHPGELIDGAIVSGNCVSACDKHTTYHHQNNPVVEELLRRDGKELSFVGMIITNINVKLNDKERSSDYAAKLAAFSGADGAIITEEGFGNPDTDLMMLCRKIEHLGIKTVLITDEYAGTDGDSQSLADCVDEATAIVSAGNANMLLKLPPLKKVIGNLQPVEVIAGGFAGGLKPDGSVEVELQVIMGATCQLGFNTLAARDS